MEVGERPSPFLFCPPPAFCGGDDDDANKIRSERGREKGLAWPSGRGRGRKFNLQRERERKEKEWERPYNEGQLAPTFLPLFFDCRQKFCPASAKGPDRPNLCSQHNRAAIKVGTSSAFNYEQRLISCGETKSESNFFLSSIDEQP